MAVGALAMMREQCWWVWGCIGANERQDATRMCQNWFCTRYGLLMGGRRAAECQGARGGDGARSPL